MKKNLVFLLFLLTCSSSFAQLTGIKTIPGSYATISAAITDLNAQGVGPGGVIFNVAAGYTESVTTPLNVKATGVPGNVIIFQKNGSGANPKVTRTGLGTVTTSTLGGAGDAVITISGTDYITFDGIDVAALDQGIEYGYYLRKANGTDGCKNVVIKNATITMAKGTSAYVVGIYSSNNDSTSLVNSATGITVTSTDGRNENITFSGNIITNIFTGILIRGYNHTVSPNNYNDQNITVGGSAGNGNTITNYAGNVASTAYGVYLIYQTSPSISYNTINNASGGTNAISTLYGIMMSSSSAAGNTVINSNSITLGQGASSGANCIYVSPNGLSLTVNDNTFSYGTFASTSISYLIYCNNSTNDITVTGNQTIGTITKTGAGELDGYYNNGTPTGGTALISNNNFSNISLTGLSPFMGIRLTTTASQVEKITNNTISNISGGTAAVYGIQQGRGASGCEVSGNIVSNLTGGNTIYGLHLGMYGGPVSLLASGNTVSGLSSSGSSVVYGIHNNLGTASSIKNNNIYNLNATNASGSVYGIYIAGGTTTHVYNNMISDLQTPAANSAFPVVGIYAAGGTTDNIYYNSVYLNAGSSGALFGSAAIYASTTPTVDMRNNILVNLSTPKGTGVTAAYCRSANNLGTYAATSNNNCYHIGTIEDATHAVFYDGAPYTLPAFKTLVGPTRDALSFSENVPFSNVAAKPYNLHLLTNTVTQCEAGAGVVSVPIAITDDFDGNVRNATSPDVGADEGNFQSLDLLAPTFAYTTLQNTSSTSARTIVVTITDPSLIGAGANQPVMYWAINAGAYAGPVAPSGTAGSQYTFTFGAGVTAGDIVKYYFVAQDQATTPNVGSSPSGATVTASPPLSSAPPATQNSYTILSCISGVKTIGTGGTYTTLTAAFADLNTKELCGPVTLSLLDASYSGSETFPLVLNQNTGSSATNTVTIKPSAGVSVSISGAASNNPLLRILNNYTIIDGSNIVGGTTRDLTLTNTSGTSPQVLAISSVGIVPIVGATVKNSILINGVNSSNAVVISDIAGTAGYFNTITLQNNNIQKAYYGIYALATVAADNGSGLLITGNDLSTAGANSIRLVGICVQGVDGATVSNNNVSYSNTTDVSNIYAIWFGTGTVNSTISGNTIGPVSSTTGAPRGIAVSSGVTNANITITGNTVTGITTSYSSAPYGIYVFSTTTNVVVEKNKVSGILNSNANGYGARGIHVLTGVPFSDVTIKNNFVWDIKASANVTFANWIIGIGIEGATSGVNVFNNSVNLDGTYAGYAAATVSTAFAALTSTTALDIRDNIFVNTYDNTNGTSDKSFAAYSIAASSSYSDINYNDYFVSGTPGILGYLGGNQATLTAWQTATGKDANSISGDPLFVSSTDLHLNTAVNSPVKNAGIRIAGVTTDIDGETRNDLPEIGGDDFSLVPTILTSAATTVTSNSAVLNGSVAANNESVATAFEYGTTLAFGSSAAATPTPVTGNIATGISYGLSGLSPNTTYYYQAKGTVGTFVYNGLPPLSFTTSATSPTVVTTAATAITSSGAVLNGTVNANNASTAVTFEYGLTASYGTTVTAVPGTVNGVADNLVSYNLSGLIPNQVYHFRVVGVNFTGTANGDDLTFTTQASLPLVITNSASGVASDAATLNGTVNANNTSTTVTFEYGTSTLYGTTVTSTQSPVTGMTNTPVSYALTALQPNTTYHFRVVGANIAGTSNGLDQIFTTTAIPPTAITITALPVGTTTATLNGQVNANNQATTVFFEYGTLITYGTTTPAVPPSASGYGLNPFSLPLTGLVLNTIYHYRIGATNASGTTYGSDLTFNTGCLNPDAAGTIAGVSTLCVSTPGVVYTVPVILNATSYFWSVPTGSIIEAGAGTNTITVNYSASAVSGNVTVYGVGVCGNGVPSSLPVTVLPNAAVTSVTGTSPLCIGATDSYTANGVVLGGGTGTWSSSNAAIATVNSTGLVTAVSSGSCNIVYTITGGCSGTKLAMQSLTVLPNAAVTSVDGTSPLCVGATTTYTAVAVLGGGTGDWSSSNTAIATVNATTGLITPLAAGTCNIIYTVNGGCGGTVSALKVLTVNSLPATPAVNGPSTACFGSTGNIYSSTVGMPSYNWTVPGGTITAGAGTNSITVTWITAGAQTVTLNVGNANGCYAATPAVFTVTVGAQITVNPVANQVLCNGSSSAAVIPGGPVTGTTFSWSNSDASIGLANTGIVNIPSFVALNAGGTPVVANVTITPYGPGDIATQIFTGTLATGDGILAERLFRNITASTCAVPKPFPGISGTGPYYYDTYTLSNTTGSTQCVSVTYLLTGTGNVFVTAYSNSFDPTNLSTNYLADGGSSSSTAVTPYTFSFNMASGATVVLVANESIGSEACTGYSITVAGLPLPGCAGTPLTYTYTVNPTPIVNPVASQTLCNGTSTDPINFTGNINSTTFTWTNSNPAIGLADSGSGNIPSFVGTNSGTAPITGIITVVPSPYTNEGVTCTGPTITFQITVTPIPAPTIAGSESVCAGSTGVVYTTEPGYSTYQWTISYNGIITSGINTNTVTVNWPTAGSRYIAVNYTNSGGCSATEPTYKPVTVLSLPVPMISGPEEVCQGRTGVNYTTQPGNSNYVWNVSAGGTITAGAGTNSISVSWNTSGNQSVSVNYANALGCNAVNPTVYNVTINPKPATPVITVNGNILTSSSATGNQWYRNGIVIDGAVSQTYTILEDGTYTVDVTLEGCSSAVSNNIVIIHTDIVDADAEIVSVYPNPNKGAFWLSLNSTDYAVYDMQVINSTGGVVYQMSDLRVNGTFKQYFELQGISAGVYTIVLRSDKRQIFRKIIINR
jgi:hypothetical protein